MKHIDLKKFALYSQKLPAHYLETESKIQSASTLKLLSAHFADFFLCVFVTSFMGSFYSITFKSLLMTKSLELAYSQHEGTQFFMSFLPLTLVSYFFSCYFLNHGQTWGMHLTKTRIEMSSKSYREAFHWAFHSFLLCVSCGTYFVASAERWKKFGTHDYLYCELMVHKEDYSIDLLQRVNESESIEPQEWMEAA